MKTLSPSQLELFRNAWKGTPFEATRLEVEILPMDHMDRARKSTLAFSVETLSQSMTVNMDKGDTYERTEEEFIECLWDLKQSYCRQRRSSATPEQKASTLKEFRAAFAATKATMAAGTQ